MKLKLFKSISVLFALTAIQTVTAADYTLRWTLAHQPARVFERAAKAFKQEVEKNSNGRIAVKIEGLSQDPNAKELSPFEVFSMVKKGEVEMCQTYSTYLGHQEKNFWVLDLPFLFRDHEHASRVLDGKIGKNLLASLESKGVKGLGFTYSGGYRVIASENKPINKLSDFKKLKVRTPDSPVAKSFMKELGAKAVYIEDKAHYAKGVQAFESTFARLPGVKNDESKYINVTNHSLFLTSILINKDFYEKLPDDLKKIVDEAVQKTAKLEREDSIQDNMDQRKLFEESGKVKVVEASPELHKQMVEAGMKVQKQYENYFSKSLIEDIKSN